MRLLGSHVWRGRATALLGALTIGAVAAESLGAQAVERTSTTIQNPDGSLGRTAGGRRGFNLFGSGDIAITGMKQVGQMGYQLTNYGPGAADGFAYTWDFNTVNVAGVWRSKYFESPFILGAGRNEFRKIRNVYPGIQAAIIGGGYTYQWNQPLLAPKGKIGPSDNSLGTIFSGATDAADGTCRDISSNQNAGSPSANVGQTLLAMSDCPVTWGPAGFHGPREIPDTAFKHLKDQLGANFNWQYWRVNPAEVGGNLGNFSTFGLMTDYTNEALDAYGTVTPRSTRSPAWDGYPMGIDMRFEAFSSALPAIANAVIWQVTLINNSANVYGTGIDYDSLYAGFETGFYDPNQQANTYYETERGSVLSANRGIHAACNGARSISGTPGCSQSGGFNRGAVGITFLKSPIGDLRNKLYTRPGPWSDPSNPHAGDTITFNHGHKCGYGACYSGNLDASIRRQYGLISSTPENILDGRQVDDPSISGSNYYYTFRNVDWPTKSLRFNQFQPAGWDYNHDGVPDTVFFDTCDESLNNTVNAARGKNPKCVSTWSDSMPGGFVNAYGNVGGAATAGPFALKAGDTTSFIIAFTGGVDSAGIEAITNNVISSYLSFWAGPTPPPNPRVVSTNVSPNSAGQPVVTITYSDAPEVWVDPFLTKYANDLENGSATGACPVTGTNVSCQSLLAMNPNLLSDLQARAASGANFKTLYVYKSCNGGSTFTADADCVGDPSVTLTGGQIGNGWRPYAVIQAGADGSIPNVFTDANVVAGRTYLYSFITQSRGFTTTILDSADGTVVPKVITVADSLLAPVNTAGANVANVYVPISLAAGTTNATFTIQNSGVPFTVPVGVTLSSAAQPGTYNGVTGNRFIVVDSVNNATGATTTTVVVETFYPDAQTTGGTALDTGAVASRQTFSGPGPIGFSGVSPDFTETSVVGYTIRTDTLDETAILIAKGTQPLYITSAPTPNETTPSSFLASPLFPGFVLSIDASKVGTYAGAASEYATAPQGDTIAQSVFNTYGLQWNESKSKLTGGPGGKYEFTFAGDAYGPNAPFTLDLANPASVQSAVQASLAARPVATTGDTTAATLAAVRALTSASRSLVPGKIPFTVRNVTFNRTVTVAMLRRRNAVANNTVLLGNNNDTLRVAIDSLTWVPGDTLALIEQIPVDSTISGTVVVDPATGHPVQTTATQVTFVPAVLDCSSPRASCNPVKIGSPGASGYLTYQPGTKVFVTYEVGFTPGSQFAINVTGATPTNTFGAAERAKIRVVPNPYIVQDQYDVVTSRTGTSRVYFTNVPANGQLRVYSVSGQFLQQLDWTAADLNNTGDLPYDLRSREGTDLASGLYIWTIQAKGTTGKAELARGKFVVIR